MAATKANLQKYPSGRDVWGGHGVIMLKYTGPTAYANPGGDQVDSVGVANQTGLRSICAIPSCMTVSGTYWIIAQPTTAPSPGAPKTWLLRWFVTATMAEVANGVNLSAEIAQLLVIEG